MKLAKDLKIQRYRVSQKRRPIFFKWKDISDLLSDEREGRIKENIYIK